MIWDGFTVMGNGSKLTKPKSKFNGQQDMTGIDKVPMVIPEAERVARKLAKTKEILNTIEAERAIPKCEDCVWYAETHSRGQSEWNRCVQPMVTNLRVSGRSTVHDSVLARNARENEELCGHNGDLFTAKTWWEANRDHIKALTLAWTIIVCALAALGFSIWIFSWAVVWPVLAGLGVMGVLILLIANT